MTSPLPLPEASPLGALTARRKPLQDSPTPAGNPTAASALLRLEALTGRSQYREIAEDTLATFSGIVEHFGLYAGSYGLALERLLLDPLQVVVVGSGPEAARLEAMAVARYGVNKTVMRVAPIPAGSRRYSRSASGDAAQRPETAGRRGLHHRLPRPYLPPPHHRRGRVAQGS